ncbi:MAG TPA: BamA/TamA family outer membrane protein, partial [Candidatus Ratteibacteria bacterium]|nr:BamA/TamA family outer membrane protein [Candidatus Ratteibacteria bacterium]
YERFFGGGIGTVRGYDERTLSPKDAQGYYVGGKTLFAQNLEMIYPLYKDMLKGVLFFDIGNVSNKWDFSELKKGVGAGIKVIIPFFNAPIEVYYGYALDEEPGEDKGQLHIGMSFGF